MLELCGRVIKAKDIGNVFRAETGIEGLHWRGSCYAGLPKHPGTCSPDRPGVSSCLLCSLDQIVPVHIVDEYLP